MYEVNIGICFRRKLELSRQRQFVWVNCIVEIPNLNITLTIRFDSERKIYARKHPFALRIP